MLIIKIIENNTMYSAQGLHLRMLLFLAKIIPAIFTSPSLSLHSSTSLLTSFFLHVQFSLTSHDLSNSHSRLLGFQIDPLSHTPL